MFITEGVGTECFAVASANVISVFQLFGSRARKEAPGTHNQVKQHNNELQKWPHSKNNIALDFLYKEIPEDDLIWPKHVASL
jgi:hypothetical protein